MNSIRTFRLEDEASYRAANGPLSPAVFMGNVSVSETRYDERGSK